VRNSNADASVVPIVIGAGAIGLSAVAALRRRGVGPIIVSDFSEARREVARAMGAEYTVDPREQSPFEQWREVALGGETPPTAVGSSQGEVRDTPNCYVYEFVGHDGVLDDIILGYDQDTQVFTAGGAPEGDHISSMVAKRKGLVIHFGGGPKSQDWYGTFDAICAGDLDPSPAIGMVVDLDGVPDALDLARRADGPARIMIHPNGEVA